MRHLRQRLRALLVPAADDRLVAAAPVVALRVLFGRFWPFARPYRRLLLAGALPLVLVPAVEVAGIWLFGLVVDEVLVPRDLGALVPLAAAYLALAVAGGLLSFADEYLAAWVGERFVLDVRARLFEHLQHQSLDALDRRRRGDLLSRLTGDVQAIERFVLSGLSDGLSALVRIMLFTGALLLLSWKLALVSLVVVPLFWLAARRFAALVKHAAREHRRRSGSLAAVAEESLANAPLVQSLNGQDAEVARFRRENQAIMEAELAATRVRSLFGPAVDLIELLGGLVVMGLGVWALAAGDLTLGGLLAFLAFLTQLYGPVRELGELSNSLFAASAGAERVLELLDEPPRIADAPHAVTLGRSRGRLELRSVTFRHPGAERDALVDVSLLAEPGETLALVGPSGAGKSTLARLLLRFDDPAEGAVLLDGRDLRDVTLRSLRDNVGLLLQDTLLPDVSVREAIGAGRPGATRAEIEAAARAAGAHGFICALPDGYDSAVGVRGARLSGGQARRVAVARALVRDTPVLVLDEPTSGLDAAARDALLPALHALVRRRTTIVISHDPAVVALADRVVAIADGCVAAGEAAPGAGRPAEVA